MTLVPRVSFSSVLFLTLVGHVPLGCSSSDGAASSSSATGAGGAANGGGGGAVGKGGSAAKGGSSATGGAAGAGASSAGGQGKGGGAAGVGPGGAPATGGAGGTGIAGASAQGGSALGGASGCTPVPGSGIFEAPEPWTKDVSCDPKAPDSDKIIKALKDSGGWPSGKLLNEGSIGVQTVADASTMLHTFQHTGDFYTPDCDDGPFPVPPGGHIEGESGYDCKGDGDCHLLVVDKKSKKLYEMWRAFTPAGGAFSGGCAVVWDLTKAYPDNLRGDGCTSADAGGFPIAAMVFSADEVAAGNIAHAIRFILPNNRIRKHLYVHPGTHSTGPTSGGADAPPYGVRLRLRADFPLASLPNDGARVVARAMQRYGMLLADGGNVDGLSRADDAFTTHKWSEVGIDDTTLTKLAVDDFEVVDFGTPMEGVSVDCVRN